MSNPMTWRILHGDVREQLRALPRCFRVQTCVTSPPYYALRDYGIEGQLGLEPSPESYVQAMVELFRDVRDVLADDGTLWLNIGDSYNANTGAGFNGNKRIGQQNTVRPSGLPPKNLLGIPWRLAFALQADGWILRADIIWSKPNPMPESVTDRPTKAHEYIFLLSKSARYYYDAAAIREPYAPSTLREFAEGYDGQATKDYAGTGAQNPSDVKRRIVAKAARTPGQVPHSYALRGEHNCMSKAVDKQRGHGRRHAGFNDSWDAMPKDEQQMQGANKRSVWHVATQPYPEAHFATYPEKLIEPCILAGSAPGDTVLDPFCGSGTTGAVAVRHQRNFLGVELNPQYVELARRRIGAVAPLFSEEQTA